MFGLGSVFFRLLRKLLFLWVRTEVDGADKDSLQIDPDKPLIYVLQNGAISSRMVLEGALKKAGLPSSRLPLKLPGRSLKRSFFFTSAPQGPLFRKRYSPVIHDHLRQLVDAAENNPQLDVQIVPVSVFWGRSPDKEQSLFKLIMSDTWSVSGRIWQFFVILFHGRNTLIQFSPAISVQHLVNESASADIATRKVARVLRVHFRRVRQATLGPDLSHRRTMVSTLIRSAPVRQAIESTAQKEKITAAKARHKAFTYADEIASNVSMATIRFLDILLTWVWNKIYNGVKVNNIDAVKRAAQQGSVIYVPCHRSHVDYLLLSYVLFNNGLMVPHIAAGINLNMPIVGAVLRRGGAFFMRRSFKNNQLYATVFNEYMHSMLTKGYPVEYFVEGGRSRTGRTLEPKAGMLVMTAKSYLRDSRKPVVFVPVYVGYEKIIEARSYLGELKGKKKKKENILVLFKSLKKLRNSFGQVNVNFGAPFQLEDVLTEVQEDWRSDDYDIDSRPPWLPQAIALLSQKVAVGINNAAAINPVNMVATVLLTTPKLAMDERMLAEHCDKIITLLGQNPYSEQMTFPAGTGADWINYTQNMRLTTRQQQNLGDIISLEGSSAILLTYYRNNILHLLALPALVASMCQNNARMSRQKIVFLVKAIYPYIKSELFLRWETKDIVPVIDSWIETLCNNSLLIRGRDALHRPISGSREAVFLHALARIIIPTLERYYVAIAILRRSGSGSITAAELESRSTQMAERMSILHGLNAPEFFDKTLFRNFIQNLREERIIEVNEAGHITYDENMDRIGDDARLVLNAELRQSILQVAIDTEETKADEKEIKAA